MTSLRTLPMFRIFSCGLGLFLLGALPLLPSWAAPGAAKNGAVPEWLEEMPADEEHVYAIGSAPFRSPAMQRHATQHAGHDARGQVLTVVRNAARQAARRYLERQLGEEAQVEAEVMETVSERTAERNEGRVEMRETETISGEEINRVYTLARLEQSRAVRALASELAEHFPAIDAEAAREQLAPLFAEEVREHAQPQPRLPESAPREHENGEPQEPREEAAQPEADEEEPTLDLLEWVVRTQPKEEPTHYYGVGVAQVTDPEGMEDGFQAVTEAARQHAAELTQTLIRAFAEEYLQALDLPEMRQEALLSTLGDAVIERMLAEADLERRVVMFNAVVDSHLVFGRMELELEALAQATAEELARTVDEAEEAAELVEGVRDAMRAKLAESSYHAPHFSEEVTEEVRDLVRRSRKREIEQLEAQADEEEDPAPEWVKRTPEPTAERFYAVGSAVFQSPQMAEMAEHQAKAEARHELATAVATTKRNALRDFLEELHEADPQRGADALLREIEGPPRMIQMRLPNVLVLERHFAQEANLNRFYVLIAAPTEDAFDSAKSQAHEKLEGAGIELSEQEEDALESELRDAFGLDE